MAWKVSVPGVAWSCPIVVGDKVFVTTAVADGQPKPRGGGGRWRRRWRSGRWRRRAAGRWRTGGGGGRGGPDKEYTWKVVCLDRTTGKELWATKAAVGKPKYGTHGSNTFASETPVSDGERVYAYFGASGTVIAYDLAGKEVWKKDIGAFPMQNNWGTSSSPVVHDGMLFVQCDNEEKSFLVAFDAKTGEQKWKVDRAEKTNWSTPVHLEDEGPHRPGRRRRAARSAGTTRRTAKWCGNWRSAAGSATPPRSAIDERLYFGTGAWAAAVAAAGRAVAVPGGGPGGGGRPGGGGAGAGTLFAVKAGATGDISLKDGETTSDGVAWSAPRAAPAAATPLVYDGYRVHPGPARRAVSCFDAKTGKAEYTKERIPKAGAFWASPWAYDGKVFCLDETGTTHVLKAGATFEVLRHEHARQGPVLVHPGGGRRERLPPRAWTALYCVK